MTDKALFAAEANFINQQLRQRSIPAWVVKVAPGYNFVSFYLNKSPKFPISRLRAICSDLANEFFESRKHVPTTVVLTEQPLSFQVSRLHPVNLALSSVMFDSLPEGHALIGLQNRSPLTLDLSRGQNHGIGAFGMQGSGKTNLLHVLALSALSANHSLELIFINTDDDIFQAYKALPHASIVAGNEDQAIAALDYLGSVIDNDKQAKPTHNRLLVIDEAATLFNSPRKSEFQTKVHRLLAQGRKHGINVIIGTQNPIDTFLPAAIRKLLHVRCCGLAAEPSFNADTLGVRYTDQLATGEFMVAYRDQHSAQVSRVQVPLIENLHRTIQQLNTTLPVPQHRTAAPVMIDDRIPDAVLAVFQEKSRGGKLARYKTAAITAYAEHVGMSAGGDNFAKFGAIIERMAEAYRKEQK